MNRFLRTASLITLALLTVATEYLEARERPREPREVPAEGPVPHHTPMCPPDCIRNPNECERIEKNFTKRAPFCNIAGHVPEQNVFWISDKARSAIGYIDDVLRDGHLPSADAAQKLKVARELCLDLSCWATMGRHGA